MTAAERKSHVARAIIGAAIAESVVIGLGVVAFLATDNWVWLALAIGVGFMIVMFVLSQIGLFDGKKR